MSTSSAAIRVDPSSAAIRVDSLANRRLWEDSSGACSLCQQRFTLFWRAHHCRLCGRCVDDSCAPLTVVFLESACSQVSVRVCTVCSSEAVALAQQAGGKDAAGGGGGGGGSSSGSGDSEAVERAERRNDQGSDPSPLLLPSDAAILGHAALAALALGQQQQQQQQQALGEGGMPALQLQSSAAPHLPSSTSYRSLGSMASSHADPSGDGSPRVGLGPEAAAAAQGSRAPSAAYPAPATSAAAAAAAYAVAAPFPAHGAEFPYPRQLKGSLMPQRTDAASSGLVALDKSCDGAEAEAAAASGLSGGAAGSGASRSASPALAQQAAEGLASCNPPEVLLPSPAPKPHRRIVNGGLAGFGSVGGTGSSTGSLPTASSSAQLSGFARSSSSGKLGALARAAPLEWEAGERHSKGGTVLPRRAGAPLLGSEGGLGGGWGGGLAVAGGGLEPQQQYGSGLQGMPVSVGGLRYCRNCTNAFFENLREPVQDALSAEASTCSRDCYSTLKMQGIY